MASIPHSGRLAVSPQVRFLALFPLCLLAGLALIQAPAADPLVAGFTGALVRISAAAIRLFGGHAQVSGCALINPVNGFSVLVENGCNGINVTVLLWSAILVFPAGWMEKMKGLAVGTLLLHLLNLLRIVTLFYLGQYNRTWFDFTHLYVWEALIVIDTLAIFWGWVVLVRRPELGLPAGNAAAGRT